MIGLLICSAGCLALITAVVGLLTATRFLRTHRWYRVAWRALTGHHLDGHHRVNKTWTRHGARPVTGPMDARYSWWARRARLHRAAAAWAVALTLPCLGYGLATSRPATLTAARWAMLTTILAAAAALARRAATTRHRRHVVRPIATALAGHMNAHAAVVASNLKITPRPQDAQPGDPIAAISSLPDAYAASHADRQWVEELLTTRIPCPLTFHWDTTAHPMRLTAACAAAPPPEVTLTGWRHRIDALPRSAYFIGVSADDTPQIWDATQDDPHAAIGGRTRRGKTNLNLAIAAQALRRGEKVTCIDPKRVSLTALHGVPGFTLANDPGDIPAMWAAIATFRHDMDQAIAGHGDDTPHLLILEEMPQLFALFRHHWETIKDPAQRITDVPAWQHVKAVLHQGAQFAYYVLLGGQDLKDNILFGSRSSFGTIALTGYTAKQWAYTVGTHPIPPSPDRKGRFQLARGHIHTLTQAVIADPAGGVANEQAWRDYALNGRPAETWTAQPRPQPRPRPRLAITHRQPAVPISRVLIGPTQAAAYLNLTIQQFKGLRRRHPISGEFTHRKRGQDWPCWTKETLELWLAEVRAARRVGV